MRQVTGELVKIETTNNSPFGEQWWTLLVDGQEKKFALWEDWSNWPKRGTTITLDVRDKPAECILGYGSTLRISPVAGLVKSS
jgi:hypothetical protein